MKESIAQKIKRGLRLKEALALVWQSSRGWTLANLALVLIQGLLPLVSLYLLKLIVDAVTASFAAPDKAAAAKGIAVYLLLAALAALFGAFSRSLAEVVREVQAQTITDRVADVIHAQSVAVDLAYYEDSRYYDTLHRAQQEGAYRPASVLQGLMRLGQSGILLAGLAGLLFAFHWAVALVLFLATIPGVLARLRYAHQMFDWQRQHTQSERRAQYFHWILTNSDHAKEIRLFGLGSLFRDWFREIRRRLREERLRLITSRSVRDLVTQASATLAIFGALAFIIYRTVQGAITLGDMVMYYQAFQRAQGAFQEILGSLGSLYEDNLFLANFREFLELQPKLPEPPRPVPFPSPLREGVRFHQVSFQYPGGSSLALKDVSLHFPAGQVVALVGENGSGKTTLIKLLSRLYDPSEGTVTVDGIDLRRFATYALRREMSVILQDHVHYHLTARENIWLGDINLNPHDDKIIAAAHQTGADQCIARLPRGYETILGYRFENEGELSTGEWQKVALARAFLREAQISILDEPTSWMDAQAEYQVFKFFRQLFAGRSVILISHRFSTVKMADYIYVLSGGRLVEEGTHDALLRLGGRYAEFYEIQARSFR